MVGITGLFLILFLVEHLAGNLLLLRNDGGALYDAYGKFMVANPLVRLIEIVLAAGIIVHMHLGLTLWLKNRFARPVRYKYFRLKDNTTIASRTTIWSGSIIFIFLVVHLRSFFIPTRFAAEKISSYELVRLAFSNPWYDAFYVAALIVLGYHLRHGFQSAMQTFGLREKTYASLLDACGFLVWFLIPLGFSIIPIYFFFSQQISVAGVH
jgi:succinate dehydrogenase / fumarate reductase cytochrome b subunit